jgi:hypothetical protein
MLISNNSNLEPNVELELDATNDVLILTTADFEFIS